MNSLLVNKYNIPGPRYTSYPTVPFWNEEAFTRPMWEDSVKHTFTSFNNEEGISLYIHLPYCDTLCTFCACHKHITKLHSVELPYIQTLIKEWKLYNELFSEKPIIKDLHLGGGTPTFFSAKNLDLLISTILKSSLLHRNFSFSFEAHPNFTNQEQLKTLYDLGARRISLGIQDYDPIIQKVINRNQSLKSIELITDLSLKTGYTSINHDLVFGLPKQTLHHIKTTLDYTKTFSPERIAFYSYAHVPWIKGNGQRGFDESDLPSPEEKRTMYEVGKAILEDIGYLEIGMDHFAKPTDNLYKAFQNQTIHRNFMGYADQKTTLMIGLGSSSISDSWGMFAQNKKTISDYKKTVEQNTIPVFKGHLLSSKDLIIRQHILNLICTFETSWKDSSLYFKELEHTLDRLQEIEKDNLISISKYTIKVHPEGKAFIRNICMAFDLKLHERQPKTKLFSMTI